MEDTKTSTIGFAKIEALDDPPQTKFLGTKDFVSDSVFIEVPSIDQSGNLWDVTSHSPDSCVCMDCVLAREAREWAAGPQL